MILVHIKIKFIFFKKMFKLLIKKIKCIIKDYIYKLREEKI